MKTKVTDLEIWNGPHALKLNFIPLTFHFHFNCCNFLLNSILFKKITYFYYIYSWYNDRHNPVLYYFHPPPPAPPPPPRIVSFKQCYRKKIPTMCLSSIMTQSLCTSSISSRVVCIKFRCWFSSSSSSSLILSLRFERVWKKNWGSSSMYVLTILLNRLCREMWI